MSLETAIQENTKALQYLAEIIKQAPENDTSAGSCCDRRSGT